MFAPPDQKCCGTPFFAHMQRTHRHQTHTHRTLFAQRVQAHIHYIIVLGGRVCASWPRSPRRLLLTRTVRPTQPAQTKRRRPRRRQLFRIKIVHTPAFLPEFWNALRFTQKTQHRNGFCALLAKQLLIFLHNNNNNTTETCALFVSALRNPEVVLAGQDVVHRSCSTRLCRSRNA